MMKIYKVWYSITEEIAKYTKYKDIHARLILADTHQKFLNDFFDLNSTVTIPTMSY